MELSDLTPEQMERARACKTPEELMSLAKEEGYVLSDEALEAIAGGGWSCSSNRCENNVEEDYSCYLSG